MSLKKVDYRMTTWPRLTERRQSEPRPGWLEDLAPMLRLRKQTVRDVLGQLV
jgi:hypothetical protein